MPVPYGIPKNGLAAVVSGRNAPTALLAACLAHAGKVAVRLFDKLWDWRQRRHERRLLAGMNARDLADLGLTRVDVARETEKPFWRA